MKGFNMKSKIAKSIFVITLIFLVGIITIFVFQKQICTGLSNILYQEQISFSKKYINLLVQKDVGKIMNLSTSDALFIKKTEIDYLTTFAELLNRVDMKSMKLLGLGRNKADGNKVFFVEFYFKNNKYLSLGLKLERQSDNGWLVDSVQFSDIWGVGK